LLAARVWPLSSLVDGGQVDDVVADELLGAFG